MAADVADAAPATASRLGLSRARILDAALDLLDREGLGAFTMRRIADELGVGTMTIYGYFRTKEELLDALVDVTSERLVVADVRGSWRDRLRALMLGIRQTLIEHPGAVELRLKGPFITAGALQVPETAMRALRDAGFSKRDSARAYRTLYIYTLGFSAFGPGKRSEEDREQTLAALSALPTDRYPALVESAVEASDAMADEALFEFGLDRLLDGLEQRLKS
jgi:AcrR family transcriptional regulator